VVILTIFIISSQEMIFSDDKFRAQSCLSSSRSFPLSFLNPEPVTFRLGDRQPTLLFSHRGNALGDLSNIRIAYGPYSRKFYIIVRTKHSSCVRAKNSSSLPPASCRTKSFTSSGVYLNGGDSALIFASTHSDSAT